MLDIISRDNRCLGAVIRTENGGLIKVEASDVYLLQVELVVYTDIQRISDILQEMQLQLL